MSAYLFASAVEADLEAIWDHIATDNVDAADRMIASLFSAFSSIAQDPGIGHTRIDLTLLPLRFWPVGSYLVLYRSQSEQIEIVAVTHGARDIPSFLRRRSD